MAAPGAPERPPAAQPRRLAWIVAASVASAVVVVGILARAVLTTVPGPGVAPSLEDTASPRAPASPASADEPRPAADPPVILVVPAPSSTDTPSASPSVVAPAPTSVADAPAPPSVTGASAPPPNGESPVSPPSKAPAKTVGVVPVATTKAPLPAVTTKPTAGAKKPTSPPRGKDPLQLGDYH